MANLLLSALKYAEMGFCVIPVLSGQKVPAIKWTEYQTRKSTAEEIKAWWSRWPTANIGIVTGDISNLNVVDLDRYKEGYDNAIELEYFPETFSTPTVTTPRGGSHLWMRAEGLTLSGKADIFPGIDLRSNGNFIVAPPSVNGNGKKYQWVEGLGLDEIDLAQFPSGFYKAIININNKVLYTRDVTIAENSQENTSQSSHNVTNVTDGHRFFELGRRDEDLFHLAHVLVKSNQCNPDFIKKTMQLVARGCNPPYPQEDVNVKISSAMKRAGDRNRNIMAEVRDFILVTKGDISVTEVVQAVTVVTKNDKDAVRKAISRLAKEGLITKTGKHWGQYHIVDRDEELINYKDADMTPFHIKMPCAIERVAEVNKGNIIVVAGESNAGKTAFLLNVALMNCVDRKVNYMSSEMQDGVELRKRLNNFNVPLDSWDDVKFQFRTDAFPDKIDPNGLNIIDYLDEGSEGEAYKMPSRLRDIANVLKDGVAFVAIQKHPEKNWGYGGAGTLNRARLYLTITRNNELKIVKAKTWATHENPNGWWLRFKLVAGCHFRKDGDWIKV